MNIYLLSQTENNGYDSYDSCVVIANNEEEAKLIHPANNKKYTEDYFYKYQYSTKFNRFIDLNEWTEGYLEKLVLDYDTQEEGLDSWVCEGGWCKSPESVTVKYIGEFKGNLDDYSSRIICASFNAG